MTSSKEIYIIHGYHQATTVPQSAIKAGLNYRCAVILGTYNPKVNYMYFQHVIFIEILSEIIKTIDYDSVRIEVDDETEYHSFDAFNVNLIDTPEEDRQPPRRIYFRKNGKLTCFEKTEFWVLCGGDHPYSDSYTASFYTSKNKADELEAACSAACEKTGAKIKEIIHASDVPFKVPWWRKLIRG